MNPRILLTIFALVLIVCIEIGVCAWNAGFRAGLASAPHNDYDRGYQEGLKGFIEMQCGRCNGDDNEPDSVTL